MKNVWNKVYSKDSSFFGDEPSSFAVACYNTMEKNNVNRILEIGCGQGRDCLFFASKGMVVDALDYSQTGINDLLEKSKQKTITIAAGVHDAKNPLPFADATFDAVYSHMFFSMGLESSELQLAFEEVSRVLKDNGFHFFSVRNQNDQFYGKGTKIGEQIQEINEFRIRFFNKHEIENLARGFKILEIRDGYEEPATLYLVTSRKDS